MAEVLRGHRLTEGFSGWPQGASLGSPDICNSNNNNSSGETNIFLCLVVSDHEYVSRRPCFAYLNWIQES